MVLLFVTGLAPALAAELTGKISGAKLQARATEDPEVVRYELRFDLKMQNASRETLLLPARARVADEQNRLSLQWVQMKNGRGSWETVSNWLLVWGEGTRFPPCVETLKPGRKRAWRDQKLELIFLKRQLPVEGSRPLLRMGLWIGCEAEGRVRSEVVRVEEFAWPQ
ncbi:MAG: hypothetical protein OHK0021_25090 [Bryobacter sp.]